MSLVDSDGTPLSETALNNLTDDPPASATVRVMTADVWQRYTQEGTTRFEGAQRLLFREGQVVPQSAIDALFADATIDSVTPATGPAAGGTAVTIEGSNFGGVTAVTFGGTAATNVRVVDETTITCTTPAHAAGAVNVVVTDDSGTVTETGGFTYA